MGPAIATWADRGGSGRRRTVTWCCLGTAAVAMLLAGGWVHHAGCCAPAASVTPALVVCLVAMADVVTNAAIPTFWALHHTTQPAGLRGCSIAVVNSVGNLGGFVGPFMLGAMHDAAPRTPCGACLAQWGGGLFCVGAFLLTATAASRLVLARSPSDETAEPIELASTVGSGQTSPRSDPGILPAAGTHVV